jgi:hypothetical protein
LLYNFEKEVKFIDDQFEGDIENLITSKEKGVHPPLLRMLLAKTLSEESFLIFDHMIGLINHFDKTIPDNIVWKDKSFKLKKYKPFVHALIQNEQDKYRRVIREVLLRK